ncbi:hypothetical protein Kfla_6649 [Kribbella flavida DSM 17836]|uniref:Patatin n=1 Tax=Kribbella flavida (strain DSM 17836 / JCM 10339 / NBRC 14399) TaxID=479435 RepID=D2PZS5_KRIFD|nr:hypothetical protein [Kribbella flavida]ADB35641.1 hypothetical protein Kfla_6649 [Kribbella flavida DSM 17836]
MQGESEGSRGEASIEQIGRRRTFTRTLSLAVVLFVVQQPMVDAVRDNAASAFACEVPGRLSLLVDVLFVGAAVYAGYRAYKYVRFLGFPGWQRVAAVGALVVCVAAALDLTENFLLWGELGALSGACSGLSLGWFSWLMRAIWLAGAVVLGISLLATSRFGQRKFYGRDPSPRATFEREQEAGPDQDRLVICCSGGGIRSASFSLGALQLLREKGLYDKASTVIGVSGGGYMAAAFHVLRRTSADPFGPGSPELARLRRQTRYLLQGTRAAFRAAMSVLFGLVVNLLLIGIVLRAIAWVLGWFLADQRVVVPGFAQLHVDWRPDGSWRYVGLSVFLLAVSAAVFVLEKVWDRWARMPDPVRLVLTSVSGVALRYGIPVAVLLLGVPGGLYLLGKLPGSDPDQPSLPSALLALVDPTKQGVASFSALVVVLVGLGRTVWNGLAVESTDPAESGLRSRLVAFARNKLAPWVGSAIIVLAAVIVLLRWTGGYATDRSYQEDWSVALVLAAIALAIKVLTDANRTSLHSFYRERLSRAFLVERAPSGAAVSLDYSIRLQYSDWAKPKTGGPRLVIAGVANVSDAEFVPSRRDCVPFVFDPDRIGVVGDRSLPAGGRRETADYEREADMLKREVTVPAAMAISGAAVSPLTGRVNSRTRPVRLLLALLNARLGVWLPNPYWNNHADGTPAFPEVTTFPARVRRYVGSVIDKPGPYRLLREAIGAPSLYDRRIYVTDGGHYDNLGLVEALRRKPAQVIVIDASNDPEDRFNALGEAIATARMDHGIRIDLDPSPLVRGAKPRADRAWAYGIATHPAPAEGADEPKTEIFFLKALLTGHLSWDVERYAAEHPDFPRRSTGDQFYDEWDFEAYRTLGYTLAETLVAHHRVAARLAALPDAPPTLEPTGAVGTQSGE